MDVLLAESMFEILSRFVEKEIDNINWDWNEEHRNSYKEIMSLYHWWHDIRNKQYLLDDEKAQDEIEKYSPEITWGPLSHPNLVKMIQSWKNPGDKEIYRKLMDAHIDIDIEHGAELKANMIRLINIKEYLWS
jgi:hypothetical protein